MDSLILLTLIIIAGKKIMPEYLQNQATAQSITNEVFEIINSPERQRKMLYELLGVHQKLQGNGSSKRAAQHILSLTEAT